jgi:hypothetical protein
MRALTAFPPRGAEGLMAGYADNTLGNLTCPFPPRHFRLRAVGTHILDCDTQAAWRGPSKVLRQYDRKPSPESVEPSWGIPAD